MNRDEKRELYAFCIGAVFGAVIMAIGVLIEMLI